MREVSRPSRPAQRYTERGWTWGQGKRALIVFSCEKSATLARWWFSFHRFPARHIKSCSKNSI